MDELEKSESGAPIYRYSDNAEMGFTPASGDGDNIDAISKYIEKHVEPIMKYSKKKIGLFRRPPLQSIVNLTN